jgi:hypothetical protein
VSQQQAARRGGAAPRRGGDSTDWVSTQLTRRFGLGGGLAWLAVLTVGVVGEQVKTRLEMAAEESSTKVRKGWRVKESRGF